MKVCGKGFVLAAALAFAVNGQAAYKYGEYVRLVDGATLSTGVTITDTMELRFKFMIEQYVQYAAAFKEYVNEQSDSTRIICATDKSFYAYFRNKASSPAATVQVGTIAGTVFEGTIDKNKVVLNGTEKTLSRTAGSVNKTGLVFCSREGKSPTEASRIYSFQIFDNGKMIHWYLPYKSDDGSVVGVRDIFTGENIVNSAGGSVEVLGESTVDPNDFLSAPLSYNAETGKVEARAKLSVSTMGRGRVRIGNAAWSDSAAYEGLFDGSAQVFAEADVAYAFDHWELNGANIGKSSPLALDLSLADAQENELKAVFTVAANGYFVDAEKGDDSYDGKSPTVDGEGVGPKKTWEACKELLTAEKDVLVFAKGRYPVDAEWRPTVKNVSFRGATGNRDDVILDGQGATRFIVNVSANCQYNFYDLTVSNFWAGTKAFEGANGYNGGFCHTRSSGTSDNGSNLYFTNVHATCCSAPFGAGGVGFARQVETHDSLFDFNAATNGGAFATSGNSGGTYFHDSTFRTNSAAVKSGVVYAYAAAAPFRAYSSRFEGNRAGNTGVANFHATLVTNCWFVGNAATNGNAGVLTLSLSNSSEVYPLTDNYFVGNTASGLGGAVEISTPNWALVRCHFHTNSSCSSGGAVVGDSGVSKTFPLIDGCTFVGNRAGGAGMVQGASGGAVCACVTHIINSTFVGNESAFMGGAIGPRASNGYGTNDFFGGYPRWSMVSNCVFRGNKAHGMAYRANWPCGGGAIDYGTGASGNNYSPYNILPLHDCVFEDNELDNTLNTWSGCTFAGGAVYAPNGVDMKKCVFRRNVNHAGAAGAIFARSYAPGITDTLFESNVAQVAAGALCMEYVEKGKTCVVSNCTFDGNCAIGTRGGAMVFSQCGLELSDCTFRGNSVVTNGAPTSGLLGGAALAIGGNAGWCSSSGYGKSSVRGTDSELKIDFTIERCTFQENDTFAAGGGIFFTDQQGVQAMTGTVRNCLFAGNVARQVPTYKSAQTAAGAAIRQSYASVSIENCTFADNTAVDDKDKMQGGAIYVATTMPGITNCVFYGNADGKTGTTYDDIYTTDASKVGYCFAKTGGVLTDKENGNIVSDQNPFRADDHTAYAVRKDCGSAAGLKLDWMTSDSLDLGGKPRLAKDGTVDFGCYQFWRKPGLLLFVQ